MQVLYLPMVKQVFESMNSTFSFTKGKRLGVAVSGGLDSMTLINLLGFCNLNLTVLHCNFGLRGDESDHDQAFIEQFCNLMQLPLETIRFDTKKYAKQHKVSTQMAARELRYEWFQTLVKDGTVNFVATAHHANDSLETLLINLSRGSGLAGLAGIPAINDYIIRPLLSYTGDQIKECAHLLKVKWREDSSNASDVYLRNTLRHNVIPKLEEIAPDIVNKSFESQQHLRESQQMVKAYVDLVKEQLITKKDEQFIVQVDALKQLPTVKGFLFEWLNPYGFTAWDDLYSLLDSQSGKQIESPNYVLTKDRGQLILSQKSNDGLQEVKISVRTQNIESPIALSFSTALEVKGNSTNQIVVDANALSFPLELRHWKDGDRFYPLGMEGSKKVSDFFTDLKISRPEKEKIWLLCSDQKIVWIVGHRADNRFKIGPNTQKSLVITYRP